MNICNGCKYLYKLSGFDQRGMEYFCKHPSMLCGARSIKHFEIDGFQVKSPDWCLKEGKDENL